MPTHTYMRNTKKAAERLDELGIDLPHSIKRHLQDLDKRIAKEEAKNKPSKQTIVAYLKEKEQMLAALALYQFIKPATTEQVGVEDDLKPPVAITLTKS